MRKLTKDLREELVLIIARFKKDLARQRQMEIHGHLFLCNHFGISDKLRDYLAEYGKKYIHNFKNNYAFKYIKGRDHHGKSYNASKYRHIRAALKHSDNLK